MQILMERTAQISRRRLDRQLWAAALERWEENEIRQRQTMPIWSRSAVLKLARTTCQNQRHADIDVEDRKGLYYDARRRLRQQAAMCDTLPDLEKPLEEYSDRLRLIVEACRVKGARLVFLTQPTLWDHDLNSSAESLLWAGWLPSGEYVTTARLREGLDQYNETLCKICAELNVECVELGSMNGRTEFFYDECHFTEAGAREVARLVVDWFRANPVNEICTTRHLGPG